MLPSDDCSRIPSPIARISVWKRFADISYQLPSFAFDHLSNVTPRTHSEPVPYETYFQLYDRLFPQGDGDDLQRGLLAYITVDMQAELVKGGGRAMFERRMESYFLPWLAAIASWSRRNETG